MNSVIKALQLQKVGDALLDSAQLTALIKYLKLFNEANPTKKTTLVATLTAHYGNQGLAKIIEAGQQVPKTARMANRLQTEQVQLWMGQGKTPEQVFGLLKLNKFWPLSWISSDLFNRPGLATWVKYLDDFNDANPDKKTTLISILSSRYSDKALANMLIQANKAQSTSSIAKRIQAEQTQLWLKHGKKPEDIFTMLQLEKAGDTLFENPLFSAWIKYADDFRLLYDTDLATMSTLISHYSDEAVAKMITKAHGNPKTKNIAERLESELQRDWLFTKQSTYDVFIMMNLDRTLDKVLENPLFSVWYNYGLYVNKMNLGGKWNPAELLTRLCGGDQQLSDVLIAATKVPSTRKMAVELQKWQMTRWLEKRVEPKRVHSLLGVEGAADDVSLLLYSKYVEGYDKLMGILARNAR
ncbi:hypothetical protein AM588_10007973 [Phytophthora nicotianae]|uniref:RxLR effector PexRD54 WY domain-containing protein n=1 Tax=Phytophthora nicotianae TaxID=4792 RepID=A0A0W8DN27_PHYNI|nr:hypothetical protein AM588_10007973 [Phytophthora nicotianae]